jgi:hypothetical protein
MLSRNAYLLYADQVYWLAQLILCQKAAIPLGYARVHSGCNASVTHYGHLLLHMTLNIYSCALFSVGLTTSAGVDTCLTLSTARTIHCAITATTATAAVLQVHTAVS